MKLFYFLISFVIVTSLAQAEKGKLYKNKVSYKTAESKNHPGYTELSLTADKSVSKVTLAQLQFMQIGFLCKEKHFHAMIENLPEETKSFTVFRCKADDKKDDQDKKEAGVIAHKKEILEYCEEPETDDEKKDSWTNDPEIKKLCDSYKAKNL